MTGVRLAVVAESATLALHSSEGRYPWGQARAFRPGADAELAAYAPDAVVHVDPPGTVPPDAVRWLSAAAPDEAVSEPRLLIAPAGEGLWRRAPLPASDALFDLEAGRGAGVVLAGGTAEQRDSAAAKLRARGVEPDVIATLTVEAIERARVVALVGDPGAALSAEAPAVLAAGRLLVAPRAVPAFGFLPGVDHLAHEHEDELTPLVDAAISFPNAFEPIVAMGRLAAEAHRASVVYGRLALDLALRAAS